MWCRILECKQFRIDHADAHLGGVDGRMSRVRLAALRSGARRIGKAWALRVVAIAALLGVVLYAPSGPAPASAQPYRTESACGASAHDHGHVRVAASGGHYVDVASRICHNGSIVTWASQPSIAIPSMKIRGLPAPQAALESVTATTPVIYSYGSGIGGYARITWRFTVTVKALKGGIPIATETYYFRVYPAYMELQGHGHLARKSWTRS
jgi:hypothetical protein